VSGDYLTDLRIRIEPGAGAVTSLREVLLVVPTVEPGQEEALEALVAAATARPVVRAVARVVADHDRSHLPGFCLVVAGEHGDPFALVHGPVVLDVRGGGEEVRLTGLASRLWVEQALPATMEHLTVWTSDAPDGGRPVLEATVAGAVRLDGGLAASVPGEPSGHADDVPAAAFESIPPTGATDPMGDDEPVEDLDDRAPVGPGREAPVEETLVERAPMAGLFDKPPVDVSPVDVSPVSELPVSELPVDDLSARADASQPFREPSPDDEDTDRGCAVIPAPAPPPGARSSSHEFRPEPVRFDGGRMESIAPPPSAVNGWHEPSGPSIAPAPPAPPAPPDPFARPAEPSPTHPPLAPGSSRSGLPVRRPQASLPPTLDRTQVVPPPEPGLFAGPAPLPAPHAFNPFEAAAPRPPEPGPVSEPATPRVRLGRLVMENGPDVVVDCDCVIGRNPEVDPDVAHGRAKPIVLPDEEQRISRVHARLVFSEDAVEIVDAGSVNGTWIEPPGGDGWIAMVPRVPVPLPLGSRIQVGDLVLSYTPLDD
jgi:hypothetical protein